MDLYFQGWAFLNKGINPEHNAQARRFFARALLLDPCSVEALVGSALADRQSVVASFTDDRTARMKAAEAAAIKALSLAPNYPRAHGVLGGIYAFTNRVELGIAECERALALDHNLPSAHGRIGMAKYFIGRGAETEAHVREALRLSPHDTFAYAWMSFPGIAKLWLGADAEAVAWLRRSVEANRNWPLARRFRGFRIAIVARCSASRVAGASASEWSYWARCSARSASS